MSNKKGAALEKKVYDVISKMISTEQLPFLSSQCKVFSHKKYFSKDRNGYIETDVSIEIYLGTATEPVLIWVWECKDYSNSIPIDDIEEFHAKLEQIGADKTKGTMITSFGNFQSGCLNYAKSKGIGLARLMPDDQVSHLMYFMTFDAMRTKLRTDSYRSALTQMSYIAENQDVFIVDGANKFAAIEDFVIETMEAI